MPERKGRIKTRRAWKINPKTRVKKSAKVYSRAKAKTRIHEEIHSRDSSLLK